MHNHSTAKIRLLQHCVTISAIAELSLVQQRVDNGSTSTIHYYY